MRRPRLLIAALLLAGAIATGATAASSADPGVTDETILLGGTAPLSGPASAYASIARGASAYFKYANTRGGVNGRAIAYKFLDDAYNAAQSVQVTRQLVEQDKVFAVFNSLGTEQNEAVRAYLNQAKVPQLFVASGATTFGRDHKQYPYTIGFQPSYQAEGWIYGKVPGADEARREGGSALPERLVRQGSARRPQVGARTLEGEGRRGAAVRGDSVRHPVGGGSAAVLRRERPRAVRHPEVRDAGLHVREPAGLAAADHQQRRLERLEHHDRRLRGRHQQGDRELGLDRLPQGPDRRQVAERRRDEALSHDPVQVRQGRERQGRLPRLRHGRRVRDGQAAEGGGEDADARCRGRPDAEAERRLEPLPAARHRR